MLSAAGARGKCGRRAAVQHVRRLTPRREASINAPSSTITPMPKPRFYIRHLCRTFYLSEWWDE